MLIKRKEEERRSTLAALKAEQSKLLAQRKLKAATTYLKSCCKCLYRWFLIYPGLIEKKLERWFKKLGEKLGLNIEDQDETRKKARMEQNRV